jgi:hypothetical protein
MVEVPFKILSNSLNYLRTSNRFRLHVQQHSKLHATFSILCEFQASDIHKISLRAKKIQSLKPIAYVNN